MLFVCCQTSIHLTSRHKKSAVLLKTRYVVKENKVIFYDIDTDNDELKTKLTYSILWFNDNPVSSQRFEHLKKLSKITCFTDILLLLEFLQEFNTETLLPDEAS